MIYQVNFCIKLNRETLPMVFATDAKSKAEAKRVFKEFMLTDSFKKPYHVDIFENDDFEKQLNVVYHVKENGGLL